MDKLEKYQLTEREVEILKEVVTGKNNSQIAKDLCLSIHTIKFYVSSILSKMSVTSRIEAAIKVVKEHLFEIKI